MAKIKTYNPPPNWPAPPEGWTPPPGWQPDPAWGPPPEAWPVWIETRANPAGCLYGIAGAAVVGAGALLLGTILLGSLPSGFAFGEIMGRCLMAAVITGVIAYLWTQRWKLWVYPLAALGVYVALTVVETAGRQSGTGG